MTLNFVNLLARSKQAFVENAFPYGIFWYFSIALFLINLVWVAANPSVELHGRWYELSFAFVGVSAFAVLGFQSLKVTPLSALFHRILCVLAAFGFAKFSYLQLRTNNYLSMSLSGNWVDEQLSSWDVAIGFTWWDYVNWLMDRPKLLQLLDFTYSFVDWPIGVLATAMICLGQQKNLREFFGVVFLTSFLCMWLAVLFPAKAAIEFYSFADIAINFQPIPAVYHIERILDLQSGNHFVLRPSRLPGLATFPSFHTALGILIIYSARAKFYTFWPALAFSVSMVAATPLFGGHYLIDIIAGSVLAIAVILMWRWAIEPKLPSVPDQPTLWKIVTEITN